MLKRTEFEGIDLGEIGQPTQPAVEAFRQRGVLVNGDNITQLRRVYNGSVHSGNEFRERLLAGRRLASNDAKLKDKFYLRIVEEGIKSRESQERESHRWCSRNFTQRVAEALAMHSNSVRLALRAMRVDLTYLEIDYLLDSKLSFLFIQTAQDFIDDYTSSVTGRTSAVKESVVRIQKRWDGELIASFYSCLYDGNSYGRGLTIGAWTTYEMGVMHPFYQGQAEKHDRLTSFDTFLLQTYAWEGPIPALVSIPQRKTLIDLDTHVISAHLNTLLHGAIHNPNRPRQKRVT